MKLVPLLIFAALFSCVTGSSDTNSDWELWKTTHSKAYVSREEESLRRETWEANSQFIEQHNANSAEHGYTLQMNNFGDLVSAEPIYCMILYQKLYSDVWRVLQPLQWVSSRYRSLK